MDLLHFIEMRPFTKAWRDLRLSEDALAVLQTGIMGNPQLGPVIAGTGGLRKARFSPEEWSIGKRGALRVCYVYFEEFQIVLLVHVYHKSEHDDISPDLKKVMKELIERQRKAFGSGRYN